MAAQIFNAPSEVKQPEMDFTNFDHKKYTADCNQYYADLKTYLKSQGYNGKNMGETIRFPHADSYAEYMVASMRPLMLIHIPLGDAWHSPDVDLMTAKRVQQKIDGQKRLNELFSK